MVIVWQSSDTAEIRLDGERFTGNWSDTRCFTRQCRGEFWNVSKFQRQHIRRGSAELVASDNMRLRCEWVSHHREVIGTCQTSDGRKFALKAA